MASFTLDDIRAAAEKKYGSTDIELSDGQVLSMMNPMRLPKEKRKALLGIQKTLDAGEVEQEDVLRDAIRLVSDSKAKAELLIEEVGDDMAVLAELFSRYVGQTELGEASASAN